MLRHDYAIAFIQIEHRVFGCKVSKLKHYVKVGLFRTDTVEEAGFHAFNVIAATFYEHYDDILNFYNKRSSNAAAESFNAKIKQFRTALRGVVDEKFFLFRLAKIYAYPQ